VEKMIETMMEIGKVRPILDQLLVELRKDEDRTKGGIWIPANAVNQDPVYRGTVVAVGPGKFLENGKRVEPSVKKGDEVVFGKYSAGREIEAENRRFVFIHEGDLLSALEA
jgi:chaperonin GroES